ncbi:MAG TPA: enoyl-CoA hydratase [Gemmataceae bacterium]|nr:enoyl-CoA hydratase [Gemmataceae bacterium]
MQATTTTSAAPGLVVESDGPVCRLILNRPERRNALSRSLLSEMEAALARVAADPAVRVVVLAARGPVFCSGHDLGEMVGRPEAEYRDLFALCSRVMLGLRRLPQPVIARVQGVATAAGCQLVAACDLAVAVEGATFATPGVKIGLFCTTPMVPLVRAVPAKAALEMLLTGWPISARRALELGLVNRVVVPEGLDDAVREYVDAILASSPLTVRLGKAAFYEQLSLSEEEAYERAVGVMTDNAVRCDAQEGMRAFLEKRRPQWTGEQVVATGLPGCLPGRVESIKGAFLGEGNMPLKQERKNTLGELAELAFRRDLPGLLQERPGAWVAYHGDRRIGIAATDLELYKECARQGLPDDECLVFPIELEPPDEVDSPYPFD